VHIQLEKNTAVLIN